MRRTRVYGPAYLDHVVRVDRPLLKGATFDGSHDGRAEPGGGPLRLVDRTGGEIVLDGFGTTGPVACGRIVVAPDFPGRDAPWSRTVRVLAETLDLGGMGAGFASAFGGELISALGPPGEPIGDRVSALLASERIAHRPIRVGHPADWTMIVTSGPFGDKLAIGFRGCHAAVTRIDPESEPCDLLVAAALPNGLLAQALEAPAEVRLLAPAMRNMSRADPPLAALAGAFDILSCNRGEWEAAEGQSAILERTPIVAVTDGPSGCRVAYHARDGRPSTIALPAFPRDVPPRDTNRAGEAFAVALVTTLLDEGWRPGPTDRELIRHAALRASAAAALVLDRERFGFPSPSDIDAAVAVGKVRGGAESPAG